MIGGRRALENVFPVFMEGRTLRTAMVILVGVARLDFVSCPFSMNAFGECFLLKDGASVEGRLLIFPSNGMELILRPLEFLTKILLLDRVIISMLESILDVSN